MNFIKNRIMLTFVLILILISLLITGCQDNQNKTKTTEVTDTTFLMDTMVQMRAYGGNARKAVDESFKRLQKIENDMSVSIESSQIYKINTHPGEEVAVNKDTFKVINKALEYAAITDGKFDPSIGPLVQLWGINTDHAHVPENQEIKQALEKVNYRWVKINKKNKTVKLTHSGMRLDLGAIAKGYAADEVRQIVKANGVESAYINLGGNVLVIGSKPAGSPWNVGIKDPRLNYNGVMASIKIKNKTIVTSGNYERYFKENGVIYHHIIDPTTGWPAKTGIISASIITTDSFDADALSTSIFILGPEEGLKLIENMQGIEGIIVTDNLKVIISSGLKNRVKLLNSDFEFLKGDSYARHKK